MLTPLNREEEYITIRVRRADHERLLEIGRMGQHLYDVIGLLLDDWDKHYGSARNVKGQKRQRQQQQPS